MKKVVSIEQMRALERDAAALGLPGPALMENAGRAVADQVRDRYDPRSHRHFLVLVGPGNNGGDGLVAARHLHDDGFSVVVYAVNRAPVDDAKVDLLRQRRVRFVNLADDLGMLQLQSALDAADLILDSILGTGRARPIAGAMADVLDRVNRRSASQQLVAVDLPTGLNADTGEADPHALAANLTITLSNPKRGLVQGDAVNLVGELVVVDIGIPDALGDPLPIGYARAESIARLLPARPRSSHKGLFGRVVVVAGSAAYTGAPVLAALGAERVGAGLVALACPASIRASLAAHTLETTFVPLADEGTGELIPAAVEALVATLSGAAAVLIGPGIGRSEQTSAFLDQLLTRLRQLSIPTVLDADALTLLSRWPRWWERLPRQSVLTPHPGELARLTGATGPGDRLEQAAQAARAWSAVVVSKGPYTVVANPDDRSTVLPFANPALATAGTGDVLAGAILGLLGQGLSTENAALAGAFVHGVAGELLRRQIGPAGGLAGELARYLPRALDSVRRSRESTRRSREWYNRVSSFGFSGVYLDG